MIIKIINIGAVSYTEASLTLINDAREAYDALSDEEKANNVNNYTKRNR